VVPAEVATTSAREALRVDRVRVPAIRWVPAGDGSGSSATVRLPRDYDHPTGAKFRIALFKVPAADPAHRIGTLFVNPGGPGGSGVALAKSATTFLSSEILNRFDIVGFDPRGTNSSTPVRCFTSAAKQDAALAGMGLAFPYTAAQETRFLASAKKLAADCSATGRPVASSMSTAEVARDLDVLRRAVGDAKLSYLGFSYGTYLGEVYANLFPDRVRALALDGVVNPVDWTGSPSTAGVPTTLRIKAAAAAWNTLQAGLQRCAAAGAAYCPLKDPSADFGRVAASLRKNGPVYVSDSSGTFVYSYDDFISEVLGLLYYPQGMDYVARLTALLGSTLNPTSGQALQRAGTALVKLDRSYRKAVRAQSVVTGSYDNDLDAYSGVLCTDSYEPRNPRTWRTATAKAEASTPYFGRIWGWSDAQCATKYWTAADEDAYRGSFTRATAAPVLIVGNHYDPATNYDNAVTTASLMPNSYLVSSESWGHTAYGTSACVTGRVDNYLLTVARPDPGTCTGDVQPFTTTLDSAAAASGSLARVAARAGLPPVVQPWTGA
ncbi:MAG: alpha/beta hydrolase, partial [Propionicimonas sp.]